LDCIISGGRGFPTGIIEIYGPEGSGKSAVMEMTLASAQRQGYFAGMFQMEYALEMQRARTVGLDEESLLLFDGAETIEDVYDCIRTSVAAIRDEDESTPIVFGWDTIASTPTRVELEAKKGLESGGMGQGARMMSSLFRKLCRFLFKNKVCLICVNQTRMSFGGYHPTEVTYGGKALRYYAWVRCRIKYKDAIVSGDQNVGMMSELKVYKNKVFPPLRTCRIPIFWSHGIDNARATWEYSLDHGLIERRGTSYRCLGVPVTRKTFPRFYITNRRELNSRLARLSRKEGIEP
jgi:recombination protein RecA